MYDNLPNFIRHQGKKAKTTLKHYYMQMRWLKSKRDKVMTSWQGCGINSILSSYTDYGNVSLSSHLKNLFNGF